MLPKLWLFIQQTQVSQVTTEEPKETSVNNTEVGSLMYDYSAAITGLIIFTVVISAAVIYVFAQPTDLPKYKENDDR